MPELLFSAEAYGRPGLGLPESRLVNCYLEAGGAGPTQAARIGRPGLVAGGTLGVGPSFGRYRASGAFNGDTFQVSGERLYRGVTLLGTLPGSGIARAAFYGDDDEATEADQFAIVRDGALYVYDGSTLDLITQFDDVAEDLPYFVDVVCLSSRFLYLTRSGRFYWSDVSDGKAIQSLSFATAETEADGGVAFCKRGQQLAVFGLTTVEWWFPTGDADAPFQATQSSTFDRGCSALPSVVKFDNSIAWLGEDRIIYRASDSPLRISNHGVEQRLRQCQAIEDVRCGTLAHDGHTFLLVTIPGQGTFTYDAATQQWAEWQSYGQTTFRGVDPLVINGVVTFGDVATADVWTFDAEAYTDDGDPITRIVSGGLILGGGVVPCSNIMLQCARGVGLSDGSTPYVERRYSDNGGRTWSSWSARSLGKQGEYSVKAVWWREGQIQSPGRVYEWRVTDPVQVTFSGATFNEAAP
jgi:hypothetical protein